MKNKIYLIGIMGMLLVSACTEKSNVKTPLPTDGTIVKADMEEGSEQEARENWIELLHQSADSVHWRTIEAERAWQRHTTQRRPNNQDEWLSIADGEITGNWEEKGSNNQAGSVIATTYDPVTDEFYLVSAGGSLFKGKRDGSKWDVINQELRFNGSLLEFIDGPHGKRLIAFVQGVPSYSDDYGKTWQAVEDWMNYTDGWGNVYHPVISRDSQTIITLAKSSYWSNLGIYFSNDGGESYEEIRSLGSHDVGKYKLIQVQNSNDILLADRVASDKIDIYRFDEQDLTFALELFIDSVGYGTDGKANLICTQVDDSTRWMYFYDNENQLYFSADSGKNWTLRSQLPVRPWNVGVYSSPTDPNFMLLGAVECFRSHDAGITWVKINSWDEYYDNVKSKLHADMMYFREYAIPDLDTFTAISNHGGLSLSYDQASTTVNVGLKDLNVSQYYSVRTDPLNANYLYAGSQDQGFQKGFDDNNGPLDFDQTISGDYGHIVFSEVGQRLWSVYPGGWVIHYADPQNSNQIAHSYTLESEDETVWLPPLAESARKNVNEVFLAGGNIDGGSGSHLIKLRVQNGQLTPSQFNFDFQSASEGKISAIHNPDADPNSFYVATTNGRFYYSNDYGESWEESNIDVPGAHYLYGASILSHPDNAERVYVGGSGYSTAPVIYSFNGGLTFLSFSDGLPPTTVFDLAMDEEEEFLFAATEAGPYVCIIDQAVWYPMAEGVAPNQTYWSVDYVDTINTVRFGTYGRGIWDFIIDEETKDRVNRLTGPNWSVYPNPAGEVLKLDLRNWQGSVEYKLMNNQGILIHKGKTNAEFHRFEIGNHPSGIYYLGIRNAQSEDWKKIIIE